MSDGMKASRGIDLLSQKLFTQLDICFNTSALYVYVQFYARHIHTFNSKQYLLEKQFSGVTIPSP